MLRDSFGRQIRDLRVSVTDRCNFKCFYCKSAKGVNYVKRDRLLTYEEITKAARILVGLGVQKIRLTGGEPLLRRRLENLVASLAPIPGLEDLALTTNGFNLVERAASLKSSGLRRVTVSLDSLRAERFLEITKRREFDKVVEGIKVAKAAGLQPVKVNCVVVRGVNDDEVLDFAELARELDVEVRFIEFMPIDEDERWSRGEVVTGAEILKILKGRYALVPEERSDPSVTAQNYRFQDGPGVIGLITPVSRPFCGECSRLRLTADGKLRTCLFSTVEHDLKGLLRRGCSQGELEEFIRSTVKTKEKGHRINEPGFVAPSRSMSYIGG